MGNFYTNYTLRGPSQKAVAAALAGRSSIVTPEQDGCVVIFDEESDQQDFEIIAELAARLSAGFGCSLLAVLNHDDDLLWYQLYVNGELMDEYNSAPNYFEETEEGECPPSGGNAPQLCSAFGVENVKEVNRILQKPSLNDDGYVHAVERHADLTSALGISSYGVAGKFKLISSGELPQGWDDDAPLVWTKKLVSAEANPLSIPHKATPGYYKVSFRAHPKLTKSIPSGWMPCMWVDLQCAENELSEGCRKTLFAYRQKLNELGFTELGFKKLRRVLDLNHRDNGGVNFLDNTRHYFSQLIYNKSHLPSLNAEKEGVVIAFTAVFQNEILSCANNPKTPFDTLPNHKVVRVESTDVAFVYQHFVEHLKQRQDQPRCFPDLPSLQAWFDSNKLKAFEERVRQGKFVRMSDYEVGVAQSKLPPRHPNK